MLSAYRETKSGLASAGLLLFQVNGIVSQEHRKAKAKSAAQKYAPRPEGSPLTYGFVGVAVAFLAIVAFGLFYDAKVLSSPVLIGGILVLVFLFSVILRKQRRRRHAEAYEQEFKRHDNAPPED